MEPYRELPFYSFHLWVSFIPPWIRISRIGIEITEISNKDSEVRETVNTDSEATETVNNDFEIKVERVKL